MNVYFLLGVIAIYAVTTAGVAYEGFERGEEHAQASQAHDEMLMANAADAAASAAATQIAGIKVTNTVIHSEVQHDIKEHTYYESCQHTPDQLGRLNTALSGVASTPASAASR